MMENANKIKDEFIKMTQEFHKNNLFEFLYSDLNTRLPYYALGMVFMRNLVKSYCSTSDSDKI